MKKKVFITLAVLIFMMVVSSLYISYSRAKEQDAIAVLKADINALLNEKEYEDVFLIFNNQKSKYQEILQKDIDDYTNKLCQRAMSDLSKDILIVYKEAGGNFPEVNSAIEQIIDKETEIENRKLSALSYQTAVDAYTNRQFDDARLEFEKVIADDTNYENAQNYLTELDNWALSWSTDLNGKTGYANACAYDGQYAYVPFVLDGIDGIYKIAADGSAVDFFPLSDSESVLYIGGINVIGEYIYFIAGEKVGSGYTFDSPYSIYEMKTDGTGLTLAKEGNFVDMHIQDGKIYVISRDFGLVEYDRNFNLLNTICSDNVVEFSFNQNEIIYLVQGDLTHNSDNTAYLYDGEISTEIATDEYLYYYRFDDKYIMQWQSGSYEETLVYGAQEEVIVTVKGIYKIYGLLDDNIVYSYAGAAGQKLVDAYNVNSKKTVEFPLVNRMPEFEIESVFYEQNKLIVEKNNQLYFSEALGTDLKAVGEIEISQTSLEANLQIINHITDEDLYISASQEPIISIIEDKQNWVYIDDELHIALEKRYVEEYNCNVYVTHIYTKNYNLLTTGNAKDDSLDSGRTYKASIISEKYNAVYAQNTDAFFFGINNQRGIIIRQGILVRDNLNEDIIVLFDNGAMQIYGPGDDVKGQQLLDEGAQMSFCFGPVLVEDYNIVEKSAFGMLTSKNPRSAIGYVEPGHYVMVACDGRDLKVSRGLRMVQLAYIFEEEGCQIAYNLDGGLTTTVLFMGNYITQRPDYKEGSSQHLHRSIAEIFYVGSDDSHPIDINDYSIDYDKFSETYK